MYVCMYVCTDTFSYFFPINFKDVIYIYIHTCIHTSGGRVGLQQNSSANPTQPSLSITPPPVEVLRQLGNFEALIT